jgi:hypothetical protein
MVEILARLRDLLGLSLVLFGFRTMTDACEVEVIGYMSEANDEATGGAERQPEPAIRRRPNAAWPPVG